MHDTTEDKMASGGKCPVLGHRHTAVGAAANQHWWPNQLNLKMLHQNSQLSDPMGEEFTYAEEFKTLDLDALKTDIEAVMTTSQDWWPADYGHYGPLFIRMAWHSAGTYRIHDGRGRRCLRYATLRSPQQLARQREPRQGAPVALADQAEVRPEDLVGRPDDPRGATVPWSRWGSRRSVSPAGARTSGSLRRTSTGGPRPSGLADERYRGDRELANPLGAVQMGLIYVNPEGPNGEPSALAAARDIRETFARMAMNDEETVALIAGGHTFGKTHGAADADQHVGPEPEGAAIAEQGLGWKNTFGSGKAGDTISSGLEGAWTPTPVTWDNSFFETLFGYEWDLTKSPAGAYQWVPTDPGAADTVPDAHDPSKKHTPVMLTTDLALRMDPIYEPISRRFLENPDQFADAFARAWYKLTHRDMGPISRYLGAEVPDEQLLWQDPVPAVDHELIDGQDIAALKSTILESGLSISQLVSTAWASASTFRGSDKRGGANGARIRLAPQKDWDVNQPAQLGTVLGVLEDIQRGFNSSQAGGTKVSFADVIVLGGCAAVELAARNAGHDVQVPFSPGRTDAVQEQTDVDSFAVLEPTADGFRNYLGNGRSRSAEALLVDRAQLLTLTAPEMTVLVGGLRVLNANVWQSERGVFTKRPEMLTTDFFVNLLDMNSTWQASSASEHVFEGRHHGTGELKWTGTAVDLVFGSNSQLRAIAEVYACDDSQQAFVRDFVAAWDKVMNLDRFEPGLNLGEAITGVGALIQRGGRAVAGMLTIATAGGS